MKLFSLSLLFFSSLLSTSLQADERELTLIQCQENHKNYVNVEALNHKKLFIPMEDDPLMIKLPQGTNQVFVSEKPKASRLTEDMQTLLKLGIYNLFIMKAANEEERRKPLECITYKQSYLRSNTTIKIIDEHNKTRNYSFFIGEEDHFYLSADMLISSIKELYYEEESQSFIEKEQPSSFYFGFNYKIGDLTTQYPIREFYNNLSLKAIAKVAKRPSASMGLGLGYHLNDNIEFFVAEVWTRDNKNVNREKLGYTPTTTYGVSFNLAKALGWFGAK